MSVGRRGPRESKYITVEIDLSECWDEISQIETFILNLKNQPFYRTGLLYCGFNADKKSLNRLINSEINFFARPEESLGPNADECENPFLYATKYSDYSNPAIAIYDPDKLVETFVDEVGKTFRIKDESALVAVILIK